MSRKVTLGMAIMIVAGILTAYNAGKFPVQQVKALRDWLPVTSDIQLANREIQAKSALLIDSTTGEVLFHKNAHARMYPASTTKLMTALIALERTKLDEKVTVGDEILLQGDGESSAGLELGQTLTMNDLINALLLPSGNDAARTIARYIAEREEGPFMEAEEAMDAFAEMMNERARQLGARDTRFANPHGLHDEGHYTTANDLALIASAAMRHERMRDAVRMEQVRVHAGGESNVYENRNQLVQRNSPYFMKEATGMKTGFTTPAGYCLVATATKDGNSYLAIILNSGKRGVWHDAQSLLQIGFNNA